MGVAVFVFTLGTFLKVDLPAFRAEMSDRTSAFVILSWVTFGVPLAAFVLVLAIRPGSDIARGILLCAVAPPVGSAAAIAAMLGLSARLALLATVAATALAPAYLPLLAAGIAGTEVGIEPIALSAQLGSIVGGAAVVAWLLRRFAGSWVKANPQAMTGISVLGLLVVALGAMHGMQSRVIADPSMVAATAGVAFLVSIGLQAGGALLFAGLGQRRALTVGLVSGNRNVTLVWAAAAPSLIGQPGVELYLAMSVFPIFMLPAPTHWLLNALRRPNAPRGRVHILLVHAIYADRWRGAVSANASRHGQVATPIEGGLQ